MNRERRRSRWRRTRHFTTGVVLLTSSVFVSTADASSPRPGSAAEPASDTVRVAPPTGEREADRASILAALERAEPGDTVLFAPGTYLIGEFLQVSTPRVTLQGHPDGTTLRGCDPAVFGDVEAAVAACNGLVLTGERQTVRGLTFEHMWQALWVGCCLEPARGENEPGTRHVGGHLVEGNTFRASVNGFRVIGDSPEPVVIRDNDFVNVWHAGGVNGRTAHILGNRISVPDAAQVPPNGFPGLALFITSHDTRLDRAFTCAGNRVAGNRVEGHPEGIAILALRAGAICRDNVIRENTIRVDRVGFTGTPWGVTGIGDPADSTLVGVPIALSDLSAQTTEIFGLPSEPGDEVLIQENLIEGNLIVGAEGLGIEILRASGNRIVDNIITGVAVRDPFPGNTMYVPPPWGEANGSGIWISPGSDGNEIVGNTFEDIAGAAVVLEGDSNRVELREQDGGARDLGDGNSVIDSGEVGGEPLRTKDPETVVMDQVEAFNAGDLEAFMSFYHEDATYHHVAPDTSWAEPGKATLRESFSFLTEVPEGAGVDVVDRLVVGGYVALQERDRRAPPGSPGALVLYEVEDGLIRNAWVYYPGPRKRAVAVGEEWPKVEWSSVDRALYTGTYRRSGEVVAVEMDEGGWLRTVTEDQTLDLVPEGNHVFAFGRYEDGRPTEILHPQVRLEFLVEDGEVTGYEVRPAEGGDAFISAVRIE